MDWVTVYKKTKLRTERGKQEEEGMKSRSMVQILFKGDVSNSFPLDVSLRDTVRGVVRCIPSSACCSKRDVYGRYEGRVIPKEGRAEELREQRCERIAGHEQDELWRKAPGQGEQSEEETIRRPKEVRNISKTAATEGHKRIVDCESPAFQEHVKDAVVQLLEEHEGHQKIIARVSEGNDTLTTF